MAVGQKQVITQNGLPWQMEHINLRSDSWWFKFDPHPNPSPRNPEEIHASFPMFRQIQYKYFDPHPNPSLESMSAQEFFRLGDDEKDFSAAPSRVSRFASPTEATGADRISPFFFLSHFGFPVFFRGQTIEGYGFVLIPGSNWASEFKEKVSGIFSKKLGWECFGNLA